MASFDDDELVQLSFLRDEETDALIAKGFLSDDVRLASPLEETVVFTYDELILTVTTGPYYPVLSATVEVANTSLPREDVDGLRRSLKSIIAAAETVNNLDEWRLRSESNAYGVFEPAMVVLELVRHTTAILEDYRTRRFRKTPIKDIPSEPDKHLWFLSADAKRPVEVEEIAYSTKELAYRLLQATPSAIAARVPSEFRVVHIEQVLRADLARNFQSFQSNLRHTLSRCSTEELRRYVPSELRNRRSEDMVDQLVRPRLTFHGTQRNFVPSIVRHGFSMPGTVNLTTGEVHEIRCGSTYGRGIYQSPNAEFSLSYTGSDGERTSADQFFGLKLFVCATIMGRARAITRDDEWYDESKPLEGADSHVGNNGVEWVVFNTAQVIPVYVIHLDWGAENVKFFSEIPQDPEAWTSRLSSSKRLNKRRIEGQAMLPGDRQRNKEAVYAKAAKYFPYGYGPATGTKFVVEEVGEISEDEEVYGDYQMLRAVETDGKKANSGFWAWVKESEKGAETLREGIHEADEYLWEREALRVPQGFGQSVTKWDMLDLADESSDEDISDLAILHLQDEA
jgi:hypothetical protein